MPLTVNAVVLDLQGKPLANLDGQVVVFSMAGVAKPVGTGRTGTDGRLSVACNFVAPAGADFQPRIQLQLKRGNAFVEASENPVSFNGVVCDFGSVSFNPSALVLQAGTVAAVAPVTTGAVDVSALQLQINTLNTAKGNLELQVNQLTSQKNTALTDLSRAQNDLAARDQIIAQKDAMLADKTNAFNQLQQTYQTDVKAKTDLLNQKNAALADLQARLDAQSKNQVPQIALDRLTQSTADALTAAQSRLAGDKSGFQLGKVSLQLKVLAGAAGQIGVPNTDDIVKVGAGALSQVSMDFHPPAAAAGAVTGAKVMLPQLSDYSESMARRKLAELQLGAEVMQQLVTADNAVGKVVRQFPGAGTAVDPGTVVVLAIGKKQ